MKKSLFKISIKIIAVIIAGQILLSSLIYYLGVNSKKTEDITFYPSNPQDWEIIDKDFMLNGKIYFPTDFNPSNSYPTILMFHGVTRSLEDHDYFANLLSNMGILSICIDFRGHGKSGGEFPFDDGSLYNATFGDALGLYRYIQELDYVDQEKIISYGISLGGGAALYLALSGLIPKFIVWYPGIAYFWNTTELYRYNGSVYSDQFEGLILAGTADECGRCSPDYVRIFSENNPTVQVKWLEGATHTDSDYFFDCIDGSIIWIASEWNIKSPSIINQYYITGYLGIGFFGFFLLIDLIVGINRIIHKKKNASLWKNNEKRNERI